MKRIKKLKNWDYKRISMKLSVLLISVIAGLFLLELLLRGYNPKERIFEPVPVTETWRLIRHLPDDPLGFDLMPNISVPPYFTNSIGARDREEDLKPGLKRIFALGDSYTFGYGIHDLDNVWTEVLESSLRQNRPELRVLNLGVPGYNTVQEVERFRRISRMIDGQVAILAWHTNDEDDTPVIIRQNDRLMRLQYGEIAQPMHLGRAGSVLLRHSVLFRTLMLARFNMTYGRKTDFNQAWISYRQARMLNAMNRLNRICRELNIKPALVLIPAIPKLGPDYIWARQHRMVQDKASELNWPYLDLSDALSQYPAESITFMPHDSHPNEKGHAIIAEQISIFLENEGLLQK